MTDPQRFLLTSDQNQEEANEIAISVATRIQLQDIKLVDVVLSVGEYLTDDDATIRAKSTAYLAAVLAALDPQVLIRQHIEVVGDYFCARIEDSSGLKEATNGLLALERARRFGADDARKVMRTIFTSAQDLQRHPQGTRFIVLSLVNRLMSNHREALKSMGNGYIVGITDLVAGEKDPRNLMIVFSMLKVVIIEWNISSHLESGKTMFDSVFCYFPITFRPPPDNPHGITAKDLKDRLKDCLAANALFAPHIFPALFDKIDSTSPAVKRDVLQALAACANSYDIATVSSVSIPLWDTVKFEVLNAQEDDLVEDALFAIKSVTRNLSYSLESAASSTPLTQFLSPIMKETSENLLEPQHKQAKQSGEILGAICAASPQAFGFVIRAILPTLLAIYQDKDTIGSQRSLLEITNRILDSAIMVLSDRGTQQRELSIGNPLEPLKDRLFELYCRALMGTNKEEVSFRIAANRGLIRLCRLPGYLTKSETGMIVQYMNEIVLDEEPYGANSIKDEAIKGLVELSELDHNALMEITFPAFMSKLPDSDKNGDGKYIAVLEGLAKLTKEKNVFDLLFRRLFSKLDSVMSSNSSATYPYALISTLIIVLEHNEVQNLDRTPYLVKALEGPLRQSLSATANALWHDPLVTEGLGRLLTVLVRDIAPGAQDELLRETIISELLQHGEILGWVNFDTSVIIFTHILAGLHSNVSIPTDSRQMITSLVDHRRFTSNSSVLNSRHQQIAIIVNKRFTASESEWLATLGTSLIKSISATEASNPNTIADIWVLLGLVRGLLLRLDLRVFDLLSSMVLVLSHESHGALFAKLISILLTPDPLISKRNHCIIRMLYPQRLFTFMLPLLAAPFEQGATASAEVKRNHLIAIARMLAFLHSEIVLPFAETLLPLLLQGIDQSDPDVKAASIDTLREMFISKTGGIESHLRAIVRRLLDASNAEGPQGGKTEKVRFEALRCLRVLPDIVKQEALIPLKNEVCGGLLGKLDDPRRKVRKEAVECRRAWLGLGEPDDDE
ncbi:MAG: hypothetical protein M1814_006579 [Vezdaea aestivalis]|nr:MAG: hypothetical protein M1814_006579 [Vezdaea aestivalis]